MLEESTTITILEKEISWKNRNGQKWILGVVHTHTHEDQKKKTIFFFSPRIEINTHHFWYLNEWEIAQNVGVERFSQKDTNTNIHTNTHTRREKTPCVSLWRRLPSTLYNTTTTVGFAPVAHRSRVLPPRFFSTNYTQQWKRNDFFFIQVIGN